METSWTPEPMPDVAEQARRELALIAAARRTDPWSGTRDTDRRDA